MVKPLQTGREVLPTNIGQFLNDRTVVSCKETEKQLVTTVNNPVGLHVYIVEIEFVALKLIREVQKQVHVTTACCQEQCSLILHDGCLNGGLRGQQSDVQTTMQMLFIACATCDVEHSRRGIAILGR